MPADTDEKDGVVAKVQRPRKTKSRRLTLVDALGEAFDEIESLACEMRAWEENMSEHFSSTEKYQQVGDAADTLENIEAVIPDDKIGKIDVSCPCPERDDSLVLSAATMPGRSSTPASRRSMETTRLAL
jgi:hypothetical protein